MTWVRTNLASLLETIESGSRPKGGVTSESGDVPSIGGENILSSGGITMDNVKLVSTEFFDRMTKGHLCDSDVLINKDGAQTGKVGWYYSTTGKRAGINEHVFLLRGKKDYILQGYIYYCLLADDTQFQVRREISGSAQPGLKRGFAVGIELDLPRDLHEQGQIVDILSTVDALIDATAFSLAKQKRLRDGLMQTLLYRGLDGRGTVRSELTHKFKDSPLGRVPIEWEVRTFDSITPSSAPIRYGIVQPGSYDYSGVRVAGIYTLNSGFRRWHMSSKAIELAYRGSRIEAGDVLLSIKGTTGRVGVVPDNAEGNISREIARIRPVPGVDSNYLRFLMLSGTFQAYLVNAEVGTTRPEISIKVLRDLSVVLPSKKEQEVVVDRLTDCERAIEGTDRSLEKLRSLKRGLLRDLLSGNRRVDRLLAVKGQATS